MTSERKSDTEQQLAPNGRSKRNFLKAILAVGGLATLGSIGSMFRLLTYVPPPTQGGGSQQTSTEQLAWPRVKITNVSSLDPTKPLRFNYPLVDTPNIMIKAGVPIDNGVGPNSDIVAYSNICQHLGCFYAFVPTGSTPPCASSHTASGPQGYCCCHGGVYDLTRGAKVVGGPPPRNVPAVTLEFDKATGDIYAVAMGAPTIFGHGPPGTSDPAQVLQNDLAGGVLVTQDTVFSGIQ